jgi:hypothetical protein
MITTTIPVGEINRLRRRAQAAVQHTSGPDGWSISPVDPMQLLAAFDTLGMRSGLALRAYVFREGLNGNGVIYAMPIDEAQPLPEDCPSLDEFLSPPKPAAALDNVMQAIDGDRSPFSYMCASLLAREMGEFGASWHGISWGVAKIIGRRPPEVEKHTIVKFNEAHELPSKLTLCGPPPRSWRPQVTQTADGVEVSFCVLSIVGMETITRLTDTYTSEGYVFATTEETIATGGGGIIW